MRIFREHDDELFRKLQRSYGGVDERYIEATRASRETFERLIQSEMARLEAEEAEEADNDAEAAAGLLADPSVTKIRQCEADDCVLLFLPAHPRRRWCSAARCGNRVRVARHYQRHKPA